MATTTAAGTDISDAVSPLLSNEVRGSVDFKGRPLARSKSGGWKSASFIIGVELAERFAYLGISSNLISYLTGPLGQTTATAAANVNTWSGTAWLLPLVGAFVADSFLGRYRMIVFASMLFILGLGFLSLSAALHSSSSDCENAGNNHTACRPPQDEVIFFFFSLYLTALAQGGNKPCVLAFGADQFDDEDQDERKAKSSLFNWWNFFLSATVVLATLILNYIQDNLSWELGFGIPSIVMSFALVVFLLGTMTYRFRIERDGGSPLARIFRVSLECALNWRTMPNDISVASRISPHEGAQFKLLDKALLAPDDSREEREVCSVGDIEEAKVLLRLLPIWFACLGYAIVFSQASTLFTKQGATMDRYITSGFQIPAASLASVINLTIVVFVPIYDRIIVPVARAITNKPSGISMLQRIGTGIFLSFLSMVVAAIVERKRLATAVEHGLVDVPEATVPMSVWWLAPQYVLFGTTDVFTMIGLQEFFYDQISGELKSVGIALFFSTIGIGNFLSSFLISVIDKATSGHGYDSWFSDNLNRARLDYFYWLLAGLSAFEVAAYVYFAKSYTFRRRVII